MRWIAIFDDTPALLEVCKKSEPAQLKSLQRLEAEILIAGGLREAPGGVFVGRLGVLEVTSRERAVELIENDSYFVNEVRHGKLLVWGQSISRKNSCALSRQTPKIFIETDSRRQ